jgi:hypothetical protein
LDAKVRGCGRGEAGGSRVLADLSYTSPSVFCVVGDDCRKGRFTPLVAVAACNSSCQSTVLFHRSPRLSYRIAGESKESASWWYLVCDATK